MQKSLRLSRDVDRQMAFQLYIVQVPSQSMQKPLRLSCDAERQADGFSALYSRYIYVTGPGKTGLMCTSTVFHFLFVRERYTHALSRNTKYLTIDDQVCFHRQLFTDAVKPRGCISRL